LEGFCPGGDWRYASPELVSGAGEWRWGLVDLHLLAAFMVDGGWRQI
jgi:hypothetical protein